MLEITEWTNNMEEKDFAWVLWSTNEYWEDQGTNCQSYSSKKRDKWNQNQIGSVEFVLQEINKQTLVRNLWNCIGTSSRSDV